MRFSANLGFLWADRPLPDAIRAAARAGFDAVECHWPYDVPAGEVRLALKDTGLPMMSLNTPPGDTQKGERGLAAVPGREDDARAGIDAALGYAKEVGSEAVHVMAGVADDPKAERTFIANLEYACAAAGSRTILIEPLNRHDAPGYFLRTTRQAAAIIRKAARPNLRLMFDCYHVGRTEGDVVALLREHLPLIGHIQFASVPDRRAPDRGVLDYAAVFAAIRGLGWKRPLGAEYVPDGPAERSLGWLESYRRR